MTSLQHGFDGVQRHGLHETRLPTPVFLGVDEFLVSPCSRCPRCPRSSESAFRARPAYICSYMADRVPAELWQGCFRFFGPASHCLPHSPSWPSSPPALP